MPADEGAELRRAFETFQDGRAAGHAHRADTALERALLVTAAAGIDAESEIVATAVRLLRTADDSGTTRLEVRDQGMTHRRWFEVDVDGAVKWGER
jgi:hypothetical protein